MKVTGARAGIGEVLGQRHTIYIYIYI